MLASSRCALAVAAALLAVVPPVVPAIVPDTPPPPVRRPMSVHNRVLLNRLAVEGHRTVQVMLLLTEHAMPGEVDTALRANGARLVRRYAAIGYLRVDVPIGQLVSLTQTPVVEAWQIASLSKGAWYRDAGPQSNVEMFRRAEVASAVPPESPSPDSELTELPLVTSREAGFTGDEAGVGAWLQRNPTFDGRGVTIAMLESAEPEFAHPALRTATALDGQAVPKVAGILNTIGSDEADDTRVALDTAIETATIAAVVRNRTYLLPAPGIYRFGLYALPLGGGLVQQYGVLRDEASGAIRVDADADGDFRDEPPSADVNEHYDVRSLLVHHPRRTALAFVVGRGRRAHDIHVYVARASHTTMVVSVAAGSRTAESLAFGVAPGARVLLVRNSGPAYAFHNVLEGYVDAAAHPDVDLLADAAGLQLAPDVAREFTTQFFTRLVERYQKPIIHGAGNTPQILSSVSALGGVVSVGGSIADATFSVFFGGRLRWPIVHPIAAAGPTVDGALKPDILAPVHRVSADLFVLPGATMVPAADPTWRLPTGYQISCCTSASSPYAAGVVALLLSAAKQRDVPYSAERIGGALRTSARFLPGARAHQQGNGLVDVDAAWRTLQKDADVPRITATAPIVHVLAEYGGVRRGSGLFEREGWHAPASGTRTVRLVRETGSAPPTTYGVRWIGNDGSFSTTPSVVLPLNAPVDLPIAITIATPGVHSAILELRDRATDSSVLRTAVTIVASARFAAPDDTVHFAGVLPLMQTDTHFVTAPSDVSALSVELAVRQGSIEATFQPSHGLYRAYYPVPPIGGRTFTKGTYHVLLPNPVPGVWSIATSNRSAWRASAGEPRTTDEAVYELHVKVAHATLHARPSGGTGQIALDLVNRGAPIREPIIDTSSGRLLTYQGALAADGLPRQFIVDVPPGAGTLSLQLRSLTGDADRMELFLYDCTRGECFSYDFAIPAAASHTLTVRRPSAGRWIAAVNAAPVPDAGGRFLLDALVAGPRVRHAPRRLTPRQLGNRWTEVLPLDALRESGGAGRPIVLCELVDAAAERDSLAHPWENRPGIPDPATQTAAIGRVVIQRD